MFCPQVVQYISISSNEWMLPFLYFCMIPGLIFGLEVIEPHLNPDLRTVVYTSSWFVSGAVLFIFCYQGKHGSATRDIISEICCCRALVLMTVSFAGGILMSIVGAGLDLFTFAVLTVFFRISSTVSGLVVTWHLPTNENCHLITIVICCQFI